MGYIRTEDQIQNALDQQRHATVTHQARSSRPPPPNIDHETAAAITGSSSMEFVLGLGGIVFAILGILGYAPIRMAAAAGVAVGFALLARGRVMASRWQPASSSRDPDVIEIGIEVVGAAVGIILGLLAIARVMPHTLVAVAALVFGTLLVLNSPVHVVLETIPVNARWSGVLRGLAAVMVVCGLVVISISSLALASTPPVVSLALLAMMCVGVAHVIGAGCLAVIVRKFRSMPV